MSNGSTRVANRHFTSSTIARKEPEDTGGTSKRQIYAGLRPRYQTHRRTWEAPGRPKVLAPTSCPSCPFLLLARARPVSLSASSRLTSAAAAAAAALVLGSSRRRGRRRRPRRRPRTTAARRPRPVIIVIIIRIIVAARTSPNSSSSSSSCCRRRPRTRRTSPRGPGP